MNKYEYYETLKHHLKKETFTVNPYREINYGIQFLVFFNNNSELIRIYESKKGTTLDLSQIKNPQTQKIITLIVSTHIEEIKQKPKKEKTYPKEPDELIGIDESGKGDYFGPLVVAGVYTKKPMIEKLKKLGVTDSKQCTDDKIKKIAPYILKNCPHSILILNNKSYNEIYQNMNNLNHILAWGHAKVIEAILKEEKCDNALSDQFESQNLIKHALKNKNIKITLYERPKAEDHIAVASASIVARYTFINEIEKMEQKLKTKLPKGCSTRTLQTAIQLVEQEGISLLDQIAKTHFSLTNTIKKEIT